MNGKAFFDTSVLLYIVTDDDWRSGIAAEVLQCGGVVSAQVLSEFVAVSRTKMRQDWDKVEQDLLDIRRLCGPVQSITLETHEEALRIAQRYGYQIYDSLMIASAIEAGCTTLYAEDMQDGQVIGALTIRNPFLAS
jgi:predicted nucleic acid-binding protein